MSKNFKKYIILLLGLCIVWLYILPFALTKLAYFICEEISQKTVYEIVLDNFQINFSILPKVNIIADSINVKTKEKDLDLKIANLNTTFRLLPLITGRLHINNFNVKEIKSEFCVSQKINIDKLLLQKISDAKIQCDSVQISDYNFKFNLKGSSVPVILKGKNLVYNNKNRFLQLNIDSKFAIHKNISKIRAEMLFPKNNDLKTTIFNVDVSNFDLSLIKLYFQAYLPKNLKDLKGVINVSADKDELITELNNCAVIMQDSAKSIIFPQNLKIKSKFNIKRKYINIHNVEVVGKGINLNLYGTIYNYLGKTLPTFDLKFVLNKSDMATIIKMLPIFKTEDVDSYKLKKYMFYGDVIGNLSVKGTGYEPNIYGDVYVSDGVLIKPIPNADGATIKFKFLGKTAEYDVVVPASNSEYVQVKGNVELYNFKNADMTITSTKNVDLHVTEFVLNPLHEILNFVIGPLPILDVHGVGNVDIIFKGNRKNPHLWGEFNAYNASVNLVDLKGIVLRDAEAKLTFDDEKYTYKTIKGKVNGQDFIVNGTSTAAGNLDFDVITKNQPSAYMYNAVKNSTLIPDMQKMLPELKNIAGNVDLTMKIYGKLRYIEDMEFNKNVFAKGNIKLKNNQATLQNIKADKTNGEIIFDNYDVNATLKGEIEKAAYNIKVKIKNEIANVKLNIPKINPNFLLDNSKLKDNKVLPVISVVANYNGNVKDIEYKKLYLHSKILENIPNSDINFNSGILEIKDGNMTISNLKGYLKNVKNTFGIDLKVHKFFDKNYKTNGNICLKTPDISTLNEMYNSKLLPIYIKKYFKDYELQKGSLNLNLKIDDNKVNTKTNLSGIEFTYIPLDLPISILNGDLILRNNDIVLNKINVLADGMPILSDGEIKDIYKNQKFDVYINSKPNQDFIDKYINKKQVYPLKIKGDIVYSAKLKGTKDNFDLNANINMNKNSSLYYWGATIGDVENAISLSFDIKIIQQKIFKLKEFIYNKQIEAQSGKHTALNLLHSKGEFELIPDDIVLRNLSVKTSNPTDARIFNVIFRKPNIKDGMFTSDLNFNGKLSSPKIIGDFYIYETNIPFWDVLMKSIRLTFKDNKIEITSKGEVMGNVIAFDGVMKNKLAKPYIFEKANLYTKDLNLNNIVNKLKVMSVDEVSSNSGANNLELSSVILNNLHIKADHIELRNIKAENVDAVGNINPQGQVDIQNFSFDIANGKLDGKYNYNFKNNDMKLFLNAENIDANDMSIALFDLDNQIYGELTGDINLTCNGENFESCMQTLNGQTDFVVKDGRMPKLGSLEYLLRAGNLVKGGITSLSINGLIDIITPLKTGNFSSINGKIRIKDGFARNIEILTSGKDLSLLILGTYNFANSNADMEVLGIVSRKISTVFGKLGNVSLNTMFNLIPGIDLSKNGETLEKINRIPGIEFSEKLYRRFVAKIQGNISGDNYVTSFSWLN